MEKRPFSLTADLNFLYLSEGHMRVFGEILSAISRRDGLICVTGGPGTGKTIICRRLLEELGDEYNAVLVTTPSKTPQAMTETLDEAFGEMEGDSRIPVAIFDEAQHLDFRCLDHIKFLTNLEKKGEKLLQIVLVGQPELAEKINHKRFTQLEQRIGAKLKLVPLKKREILFYVNHRLAVAGVSEDVRFTKSAARYLYRETAGVPRLINRIANIAVEQALQEGKGKIGAAAVKRAASKVSASRSDWKEAAGPQRLSPRLSVLILLLVLSVGLYNYYNPEWLGSLSGTEHAETRLMPAQPQFALKLGAFLQREQADEFRERLAKEDLKAAVAAKDLGDGWILYQVRLPGPYTQDEAIKIIGHLHRIGIREVEKLPISPNKSN
ncbi:MAG: AAA family ATPase [Deltaproteobacteria bacterium]|nr:AAA family ATPase [Deltaproteobacteria bacterium]